MSEGTEDICILRLARLYEEAYQAFVRDVLREHPDEPTRLALLALVPPDDGHVRDLERHEARLRMDLSDADGPGLAAGALSDIVDVERATREFYFENADRMHDPALARLFREFAHDGTRHVEVAEAALADYRRREGLRSPDALDGNNDIALWEGTGDFGPIPPR